MGTHRIEVGLMLRKAMLTSCLLYLAEAWSAVSENKIKIKDIKYSSYDIQPYSKNKEFDYLVETCDKPSDLPRLVTPVNVTRPSS